MKKIKKSVLPLLILTIIIVASGYTNSTPDSQVNKAVQVLESKQNQMINMFVTHGHCSTPFTGVVHNLKVNAPIREDLGNPLEDMDISFEVDPTTFRVCSGDEATARIKTPGLFIGEHNEKIIFKSTEMYTMGLNWYQVNGTLSIKGIEKKVKLFVTGIRDPKDTMASALVIEGQMNLLDWGIDYDKIVNGTSDAVPTKWMHINMKVEMAAYSL
jgi:polyisoprenoid-binding protein YceI